VPEAKPVMAWLVALLLHLYLYGAVHQEPVAVAEALPLLDPQALELIILTTQLQVSTSGGEE
jgi:hypothetical protein